MESTESTPTSVRGGKAHRERVPAKQEGGDSGNECSGPPGGLGIFLSHRWLELGSSSLNLVSLNKGEEADRSKLRVALSCSGFHFVKKSSSGKRVLLVGGKSLPGHYLKLPGRCPR